MYMYIDIIILSQFNHEKCLFSRYLCYQNLHRECKIAVFHLLIVYSTISKTPYNKACTSSSCEYSTVNSKIKNNSKKSGKSMKPYFQPIERCAARTFKSISSYRFLYKKKILESKRY